MTASNSSGSVARGDPAGLDVQTGDASVVAVQKRHHITRQVGLVGLRQAADDGAVDGDITRLTGVGDVHEDVARMHIGVEEVVLEELREERLYASLSELLHVRAGAHQRIHIGDRRRVNAFQNQDRLGTTLPVDLRRVEQLRACEVAPQGRRIGGLLEQIQFVEDGALIVRHHSF